MNNQRRRQIRRLISIGSGIFVFFGILAGVGYETQFYNHYNPLYNPALMIGFGFGFYILRGYYKDKKESTTLLAFFDTSGAVEAYDIEPSEEDSTHIKYTDEQGETVSIKHSHPFLFLHEDGMDRTYYVPRKGRKTLNPRRLVEKYGKGLNKEEIKQLTELETKINALVPQYETLNPELLSQDMTEQDEPDTLFEEFTHHVAEIRRAVQDILGAKPPLLTLLLYAGAGGLAMLVLMILGHADFSHVSGIIR